MTLPNGMDVKFKYIFYRNSREYSIYDYEYKLYFDGSDVMYDEVRLGDIIWGFWQDLFSTE